MKYLLAVTAFVCLCSCAWAWGSGELSCASCGSECQSACGTRHFRACCFNFQRRRRSEASKNNPTQHEQHSGLSGNFARDGRHTILKELLGLPQVAAFIQQLGNRLAAGSSGLPRSSSNILKRGGLASKRELFTPQGRPGSAEDVTGHGLALGYPGHGFSGRHRTLDDFLQRQILFADAEDDDDDDDADDEGDEEDEEDFVNAYSEDLTSGPLLDLSLLRSSSSPSSSSSSSPRVHKSQKEASPMSSPTSPEKSSSSFSSSDVSLGVNQLLGRVLKSVYPLTGGKRQGNGNSD
ncbi:trissin [Oratosquilla oratoria]|uniref:trissin n=1 Tax=Oratosquilla oratoria TaxID=337810 RepID=UPI003F76C48B